MYQLLLSEGFRKKYKKLTKNNPHLKRQIAAALFRLQQDPLYPSLRTHKVQTKSLGEKFSSSVNGDIRIIWDFNPENQMVIKALDIGGHSGKNKVYP